MELSGEGAVILGLKSKPTSDTSVEDYNREVREDDEARSSTERWEATGGRTRVGGKGQGICGGIYPRDAEETDI